MALVPHIKEVNDDSAMLCWDVGDIISVGESKTVQLAATEGSIEIDVEFANGYDEKEGGWSKPTITVNRFSAPRPFVELPHISAMLCNPNCSNKNVIYSLDLRSTGVAVGIPFNVRGPHRFHFCLELRDIALLSMSWDKELCDSERFSNLSGLFNSSDFCDVTIVSMDGVEMKVHIIDG